jgi:phosphate-selective porin OprO/OprP
MTLKSVLGASWLALATPALAQQAARTAPTDGREQRIEQLEERLTEIQAELEDLKARTTADSADIRRIQSEAPQVVVNNGRPTITTADASQRFAVRSIVQFDASHYDQHDPASPDNRRADTTAASDLNSGTNFRRARLGIEGTVARDWNYALWGEWGGSGSETPVLNQAYLEYTGWKPLGADTPLRFRIGAWATPTGLEDATPTSDLLFVERPAAAELVRGLAGGDGRSGVGLFANGTRWYASGVLTGASVGNTGEFDEQTGYLARVAFLPLRGENYAVHAGLNVSGIIDPADTNSSPADAQALRLRERPELRTDATRFADTGSIPSSGAIAYGGELGASFNNFYIAGEAFRIDVDRTGVGADPHFQGWYLQGAWTLTGERHTWNPSYGGFAGIRPTALFDLHAGGLGAWEIVARYSDLNLNFHEGALGGAAVAGDTVRGGEQQITTLGLNWYPNNVVRFLLDYQWVSIDRLDPENGVVAGTTIFGGSPSVIGDGAQIGQDYQVVTLRTQFAF